jgi:hypothetical protein
MQPCATSGLTLILLMWKIWWATNNASKWQMGFNSVFKGLTINCYRFCWWAEQVPWEPSKYCSFAYREEPNRNVLSPCFSLVFKRVAGVLILSHVTAPLLIHFSLDMHKANRKQHTGESGTLGETQKGEALLTEWPLNWTSVSESFIEQPPMFRDGDKHHVLAA